MRRICSRRISSRSSCRCAHRSRGLRRSPHTNRESGTRPSLPALCTGAKRRAALMISPLDDGLQMLLFGRDKPPQMALEQKRERPFELENIAHERTAVTRMKFVHVTESPKKSAHHFVDEAARAIDFRDPGREPLANSEMAAFERQQVAELQHARRSPRLDNALTRERCAFGVHIDVEREIE